MYINGLAAEAEDAVKRNHQGTVYEITKLISGKYKLMPTPPSKTSKDHF